MVNMIRNKNLLLASVMIVFFILGFAAGTYMDNRENMRLPHEIVSQLKRFSFINRSTGLELFDYKVISVTRGTYGNGDIFETFVIGFEDRPLGAGADQDFLDVIVEIKRAVGDKRCVVRMAQIGLDTIDVYLDDKYLGSLRPLIEIELY